MRRATDRERALYRRAIETWRGPRLPNGIVRAKRPTPRSFDPDQLAIGTRVELEHTRSPALALEIAMAHLSERPDYYARLERYVELRERAPRARAATQRRRTR